MEENTKIERAYEITDAKISFVSLVDAAANRKTFLVTRAKDGQAELKLTGRIIRQDDDKHLVTGVVYEPLEEDTWGTYMSAEEIEKAAHWFMRYGSRNNDIQHSYEPNPDCTVVESWIARSDTDIGGETVKAGTWLMTVEVTDSKIWRAIETGQITGLSMGGVGTYSEEDVDLESIEKSEDAQEKRGLLRRMAEFLGISPLERGEMADMYSERTKQNHFWEAFNSLEDTLRKYDYREEKYIYETDGKKIREALSDFDTIIKNILTSEQPIAMAIAGEVEKNAKEEIEVTKEQLEEVINKAVERAVEKLTKAEDAPAAESPAETPATETAEQTASAEAEAATETPAAENAEGTESAAAPATETPAAEAPLTRAMVEEIVRETIEKASAPKEETLTAETVTEMVNRAVTEAVQPVLKHVGTPGNLNGDGVERSSNQQHYLHGIL